MNYFDLIFVNKSILRIFQLSKFKSKKLNGNCIEFGADYGSCKSETAFASASAVF